MFGMMNGKKLSVKCDSGLNASDIIANGVRGKNDINAMASKNGNMISIMVWNYHDDNIPGGESPVELAINGISNKKALVHHYRIDQQLSNSFEKWKAMGKPQNVTDGQYKELEKAGQLQLYNSPRWNEVINGKTVLKFNLPRQAVSLIQITW
jgi:xylan 1,4-beta-xylosidase